MLNPNLDNAKKLRTQETKDHPMMFEAPVAGQSLTKKLGSRPYENPPELSKVDEVLALYLDTLKQSETQEEIFTLIQQGIPIKAIVQGMTKKNVMDGLHTLDVSYIIEPVLIEIIKNQAEAMNIDYLVSYKDLAEGRVVKKAIHDRNVNDMTRAQLEGNSVSDILRKAGLPTRQSETEPSPDPVPINAQQQAVQEEQIEEMPMKKGLMARPTEETMV